MKNVAIIGANGALGDAFVNYWSGVAKKVYAFSRAPTKKPSVIYMAMDYNSEDSIQEAAKFSDENFDLVIVATGFLHDETLRPEKSLRELSINQFQHMFMANTIVPAMVAKYFLPKLNKKNPSQFVVLSARVGSISDNRLGGWYSYRASKAALNMIVKNAAIEIKRTHPLAMVLGVHPGTVDSPLSKPFQEQVPKEKLFSPEFSVHQLVKVLRSRSPEDTGKCFAWDGQEILP